MGQDYRGRTKADADYGMGEHTVDADGLGVLDGDDLTATLMATFEAPGYQPPRLPTVAMELVALSRKPDVDFKDIEQLLEQDAMLAGEVLRLSRSAYYTRVRAVGSLREAVVRLGLKQIRDVVLQAAMNVRVFRSKAYRGCMERLRTHSRATAHIARIVSRYTPIDEEQAFLCGLLHDIGFAGCLLVLGETKRGAKPPRLDALWGPMDEIHARAGQRIVSLWKLPPEISMVVGAHHQVSIEGFDHPVAATICVAEAVATDVGVGFVPKRTKRAAADDDAEEESAREMQGLVRHGRVDMSDQTTLTRAHAALGLNESTLELIRRDTLDWLRADTLEPA